MIAATLYCGDAREVLRSLPEESIRCCVTSPPYWGLRDYGTPEVAWEDGWVGHLGLEPTPELYVAHLVEVFREVRRVLMRDGTLWLNIGDCYATGAGRVGQCPGGGEQGARWLGDIPSQRDDSKGRGTPKRADGSGGHVYVGPMTQPKRMPIPGLKPKDLVMAPARAALALQADGWWLRSEIIWSKPNGMPESVQDRPSVNHEHVFLLSKSERYYYDAAAIAEDLQSGPSDLKKMREGLDRLPGEKHLIEDPKLKASASSAISRKRAVGGRARSGNLKRDLPPGRDGRGIPNDHRGRGIPWENDGAGRNARTVWTIPVQPYRGAHFATFPEELARRCILAGSAVGDIVLDPCGGSGTVAQVATGNARESIYIDLKAEYLDLAEQRIGPMLCRRAE